ncbi:hypothetical protein KQX54_013330 [Cotesia glomerata]|uniref:Uncharacterized protein n=1 Tax=Cotesia glomerata TaxID=32391 RepID=A0AAV7IAE8_COTGL|nr:hypothetical protein KQX54_013330 [Cotesia glomerata]
MTPKTSVLDVIEVYKAHRIRVLKSPYLSVENRKNSLLNFANPTFRKKDATSKPLESVREENTNVEEDNTNVEEDNTNLEKDLEEDGV